MKLLLIILLFSSNVFALDAVVTVLETPMLKDKSLDAPVVQYLRKGDVIQIHPSIANDRRMDQYAPSPKKLARLQKELRESEEYNQDPLFKGEEKNTFYLEDQFIPTLDRQGNTVYVISEHIFVYFGDSREFAQRIPKEDPTDYRLEEPLPKNYPLISPKGYRGQFILGLTQPYFESYPYRDNFQTKGYDSPVDASITFLRGAPGTTEGRLFIGGSLNFRLFENAYTFQGRRFAEEQGLKLGIGPTISYDAFKGEENRINLSLTVIINFIDRLFITQSLDEVKDERLYTGNSIAPRLSLQYHRKGILEELDLILGTSMEVGTATTFRAKTAGTEPSWWQSIADDKFTTRTTFTLGGYVGIQSAY